MPQELTVAQVLSLEEGTQFQLVDAIVVAVNNHGFVVANENMRDFIFVNTRIKPYVRINYRVTFIGTKKKNGDLPVIEDISKIQVLSYSGDCCLPESKMSFPGYILDNINLKEATFCKVCGKLEKSGEHYFVRIYHNPSNKCNYKRVVSLDDAILDMIENVETEYSKMDDYSGHFVEVYGFWNGVTKIGNRECVNIVVRKISDLALYDTPAGLMRTSDQPMFVKNAVVAATAHSPGHTSMIVLCDPEKGDTVQLTYSPDSDNANVLVNCKPGDRFDVLYCYVQHELAEENGSWSLRHLQYQYYYEGYTPGNTVPTNRKVRGPFTNEKDFKVRYSYATLFSVLGTVNPNSNSIVLSDGYRIYDYNHGDASVLYGKEKRTVIARGYFLYHCSDCSYCIFNNVELFDQAGAMTIQGILDQKEGAAVKTGVVTVSSFTADGFTVCEGGSDDKVIYVDLSGMPAGYLKSLKLNTGSRVTVSGTRKTLTDPTGQKFIFFDGACIGGDNVKVSDLGVDYSFSMNSKIQDISWPDRFDNACRIRFRGKLVKSGEYYQLEYSPTPAQYIRPFKPDDQLKEILEKNLGMYVVFDGYYIGYTGSMTTANPRYWYWVLCSIYCDFSSTYTIADANENAPLRRERINVNGQGGVPVTIFNKGDYGVFTIPANVSSVSLYAVSNKKVTFHFGGGIKEIPASDTRRGLVVDGSNRIDRNWSPMDKDFGILFSWESAEEDQEDIDVYLFGIR